MTEDSNTTATAQFHRGMRDAGCAWLGGHDVPTCGRGDFGQRYVHFSDVTRYSIIDRWLPSVNHHDFALSHLPSVNHGKPGHSIWPPQPVIQSWCQKVVGGHMSCFHELIIFPKPKRSHQLLANQHADQLASARPLSYRRLQQYSPAHIAATPSRLTSSFVKQAPPLTTAADD
eukprot:scaffold1030_cov82-Skeletonema_marinoi.AAC.4